MRGPFSCHKCIVPSTGICFCQAHHGLSEQPSAMPIEAPYANLTFISAMDYTIKDVHQSF